MIEEDKKKRNSILAVDIGIKNFAFIICSYDNGEEKNIDLKYIECIDLSTGLKVTNLSLTQTFLEFFHTYVKKKIIPLLSIFNVKICLIEKQLWSKNNIKCSRLFEHLYANLLLLYPSIKIISFPSRQKYLSPEENPKKRSGIKTKKKGEGRGSYRQRKKEAVEHLTNFLEKQGDEVALEMLKGYKKKDDIADCFLMIFNHVLVNKKKI